MRRSEPHGLPPLDACPALVLNADYRPLSYFPLSTWHWQETIKAIFLERVLALSHYDRVVHSPSSVLRLPSVVALKEYIPQNRRPPTTGSMCSCAIASAASIAAMAGRPRS